MPCRQAACATNEQTIIGAEPRLTAGHEDHSLQHAGEGPHSGLHALGATRGCAAGGAATHAPHSPRTQRFAKAPSWRVCPRKRGCLLEDRGVAPVPHALCCAHMMRKLGEGSHDGGLDPTALGGHCRGRGAGGRMPGRPEWAGSSREGSSGQRCCAAPSGRHREHTQEGGCEPGRGAALTKRQLAPAMLFQGTPMRRILTLKPPRLGRPLRAAPEVKAATGLPTSAPLAHRPPVESRKALTCRREEG